MKSTSSKTNSSTANFLVDPRLAGILGENYSSSERALRELVDNAWDAEATEVRITLPDILSDTPILIVDNGSGMKEQELRKEYLNIANPRLSRKGERTPNLLRIVKGRRGVGKFAGLILAEQMEVDTKAKGVNTRVIISKNALFSAGKDLEQVPLPMETNQCNNKEHGTAITLRNLNQNLNYPKAEKLREILAFDYGRETDFAVFINNEQVLRHDVQGTPFTKEYTLPNGKKVTANFTITDKPVPSRKAGIILRAGDKTVGKPHHWGMEHDETLSDRLRCRVVGEVKIDADAIELTAAGGDVIESDKGFEFLTKAIQEDVKASLTEIHTNEVNLAKGRWTQLMKRRLETVPAHRRSIVEDRLEKLISRSYQEGEKEERITVLVGLVMDALEMDEYWTVCREIEDAEKVDVFHFAEALDKFGLTDLAFIGQQTKRRTELLDYLDKIAADHKTTEKQMHVALQHSLWIFGSHYSIMASNHQLQSIVEDYTKKTYKGSDSSDRPDLLLAANIDNKHLLIEFKRPSLPVGRDAESQAKKYADTLTSKLGIELEILIVGGEVDSKLQSEYTGKRTRFLSYRAVISSARTELEWLLKQLNEKP
jgi:hypothetical protein